MQRTLNIPGTSVCLEQASVRIYTGSHILEKHSWNARYVNNNANRFLHFDENLNCILW